MFRGVHSAEKELNKLYKNIIHEIGRRITERSGDKRETLWLKQRLSIAIQKGNALSIVSSAKHLTLYP